MREVNKDIKEKNRLDFNTYCVFTQEKQSLKETIGLMFRDYIEKLKTDTK